MNNLIHREQREKEEENVKMIKNRLNLNFVK